MEEWNHPISLEIGGDPSLGVSVMCWIRGWCFCLKRETHPMVTRDGDDGCGIIEPLMELSMTTFGQSDGGHRPMFKLPMVP